MRNVFLGLIAALLAYAYCQLTISVVGEFIAVPWPMAGVSFFGSKSAAAVAWLQGLHTIAVFVAAAPIALAACYAFGRRAALFGAVLAGLSVLPGTLESISVLAEIGFPLKVVAVDAFDTLKIILAVPFLAIALQRLPSNTSLERSRDG